MSSRIILAAGEPLTRWQSDCNSGLRTGGVVALQLDNELLRESGAVRWRTLSVRSDARELRMGVAEMCAMLWLHGPPP